MFAFFIDQEFKGFWSNTIGDIFFDLTCKSMKWDKLKASLVYYPELQENEIQHANATELSCDVYNLENQQTGEETVDILDENGIKTGEEIKPIFEDVLVLIRSVDSIIYAQNGQIINKC
jgi:hypothetical protein